MIQRGVQLACDTIDCMARLKRPQPCFDLVSIADTRSMTWPWGGVGQLLGHASTPQASLRAAGHLELCAHEVLLPVARGCSCRVELAFCGLPSRQCQRLWAAPPWALACKVKPISSQLGNTGSPGLNDISVSRFCTVASNSTASMRPGAATPLFLGKGNRWIAAPSKKALWIWFAFSKLQHKKN